MSSQTSRECRVRGLGVLFSAHIRFRVINWFARERTVCLGFLLITSQRNSSGENGRKLPGGFGKVM